MHKLIVKKTYTESFLYHILYTKSIKDDLQLKKKQQKIFKFLPTQEYFLQNDTLSV